MQQTGSTSTVNNTMNPVQKVKFEDPYVQIVEISGSPITADSDRCFWQSEY